MFFATSLYAQLSFKSLLLESTAHSARARLQLAKEGRTVPLEKDLGSDIKAPAKAAVEPSKTKESNRKTGWLGVFGRLYG